MQPESVIDESLDISKLKVKDFKAIIDFLVFVEVFTSNGFF